MSLRANMTWLERTPYPANRTWRQPTRQVFHHLRGICWFLTGWLRTYNRHHLQIWHQTLSNTQHDVDSFRSLAVFWWQHKICHRESPRRGSRCVQCYFQQSPEQHRIAASLLWMLRTLYAYKCTYRFILLFGEYHFHPSDPIGCILNWVSHFMHHTI